MKQAPAVKGLRPLVLQLPHYVHEHLLDAAAVAGACAAEHGAALLTSALTGGASTSPIPVSTPVAPWVDADRVSVSTEPVIVSTGKPTARERRTITAYAAAGHEARAIARLSKIPISIVRQVLERRKP